MNENGSHLAISQLQPMQTSRNKVWIGFYKSLNEVTRAKLTRGQRESESWWAGGRVTYACVLVEIDASSCSKYIWALIYPLFQQYLRIKHFHIAAKLKGSVQCIDSSAARIWIPRQSSRRMCKPPSESHYTFSSMTHHLQSDCLDSGSTQLDMQSLQRSSNFP